MNGTPYVFTVVARNAAGTSPESAPSNQLIPRDGAKRPGKPLRFTASALVGGRVRLTWRPPGSDGGVPITRYRIAYRKVGSSKYTSVTMAGTQLSAVVKGLPPGVKYFFRVRAVNEAGPGKGALVNVRVR